MNNKGFTLVEIISVIAVIAILSLVAIPVVSNSIKKSEQNAFKSTVKNIVDAAKIYRASEGYSQETFDIIDVTGDTLDYENKSQILSGTIQFVNNEYIINDIRNEKYCAKGKSTSFEIYEGTCE